MTDPVLGLSICGLACHNQGRGGTCNKPVVHVSGHPGFRIQAERGHIVGALVGHVKPAVADQMVPRPVPSAWVVCQRPELPGHAVRLRPSSIWSTLIRLEPRTPT